MAAVTHFVGPDVQVGPLLRQLCAWCGHRLIDYDLRRVAVREGDDPRPATWTPGVLVTVDGGMTTLVQHDDPNRLPPNACALTDLDAASSEMVDRLLAELG
jgi:hypothetical protein